MTQALGDATINELETGLAGSLVRPGDGEYEEARRIWNGAIDKHPAMIVRPAGTDETGEAHVERAARDAQALVEVQSADVDRRSR